MSLLVKIKVKKVEVATSKPMVIKFIASFYFSVFNYFKNSSFYFK